MKTQTKPKSAMLQKSKLKTGNQKITDFKITGSLEELAQM